MMPLLNYSTKVSASKTTGQIQEVLVKHGARAVLTEFDNGEISALSFKAITAHGEVPIRLPVDVDATLRVMERQRIKGKIPRSLVNREQARRVAWRIIKDWVSAQMALLETEMVRLEQIFLPYIVARSGKTVFEVVSESKFLQIGQGTP